MATEPLRLPIICDLIGSDHKIVGISLRFIALFAALFWLASCAETQLAVHTAKTLDPPEARPQGTYKVGKPYQIAGTWYYPAEDLLYLESGIASWYGPGFNGKRTANGEVYDENQLTGAHRTLPMPSIVRVTNLQNGRSIKLRINDRGPFAKGRIIDVSRKAARLLAFERKGTAKVKVEILAGESRRASALAGQDMASANAPEAVPVGEVTSVELPPPGAVATLPESGTAVQSSPNLSAQIAARPARSAPLEATVTRLPVVPSEMYVQAGAFGLLHNAIRLKARLSSLGPVRIVEGESKGARLFKVRLGPVASVKKADQLITLLGGYGIVDTSVVVE